MSARILIIEDDVTIGSGLQQALRGQGYDVRWAATASEGLDAAATGADLVLLDLGLPDADGVDVCRRLRRLLPDVAIVVLTARHEEVDIVVSLDAGADDYLTKPFRLAELLARVRAHLRRGERDGPGERLVVGELDLDLASHQAWLAGEELVLRSKEFDLLTLLMGEAGRVVSRERIMAEVWDEHWFGSTKTLDMHVSNLRRKLGAPGRSGIAITTLRGIGYRLDPP